MSPLDRFQTATGLDVLVNGVSSAYRTAGSSMVGTMDSVLSIEYPPEFV
jgi:hypothetical protein